LAYLSKALELELGVILKSCLYRRFLVGSTELSSKYLLSPTLKSRVHSGRHWHTFKYKLFITPDKVSYKMKKIILE